MEIKQLQYLVAAIECGSFNKAAEKLYTSQSNVSKVLKKLEADLQTQLFERTAKGVYLTVVGQQVYSKAKAILQSSDDIFEIADNASYDMLRITCYPSQVISSKLTEFYNENRDQHLHIEFIEGKKADIINYITSYQADIGIIFYPTIQDQHFKQMLKRNHLEFELFHEMDVCIYAGPHHHFYHRDEVYFEELRDLKFVQETQDYFTVIEQISLLSDGQLNPSDLKHVVHSNSGHAVVSLLFESDLSSIGMGLTVKKFEEGMIKTIKIADCKSKISLGYIYRGNHSFSTLENKFLKKVKSLFNE